MPRAMAIIHGMAACAALCLIVWPMLTLLHELGHALVALMFGRGPVQIRLGRAAPSRLMTIGRLQISSAMLPLGVGRCVWPGGLTARAEAVALLMGPITSALLSVGLWRLSAQAGGVWRADLLACAAMSGLQAVFTIVPMRYPSWFGGYAGQRSDGLKVWQSMRGGANERA